MSIFWLLLFLPLHTDYIVLPCTNSQQMSRKSLRPIDRQPVRKHNISGTSWWRHTVLSTSKSTTIHVTLPTRFKHKMNMFYLKIEIRMTFYKHWKGYIDLFHVCILYVYVCIHTEYHSFIQAKGPLLWGVVGALAYIISKMLCVQSSKVLWALKYDRNVGKIL